MQVEKFMASGSYFVIKSHLNAHVLDVVKEGGAGSKVITYKKHGKDNQLWYEHEATGTIRTKYNDLCLEIKSHLLIINPFEVANTNQQWKLQDGVLRNRLDHNRVIEILNASIIKDMDAGDVGEGTYNGNKNQIWEIEIVKSAGAAPQTVFHRSVEFYIQSDKNGKVVCAGTGHSKDKKTTFPLVVMKTKEYPPPKSQLWYENVADNFIHSSLNDSVFLEAKNNTLTLAEYRAQKKYQWKIDGKKIVNSEGLCLDIKGDSDKEDAELCAYKYNNAANQHWTIIRI